MLPNGAERPQDNAREGPENGTTRAGENQLGTSAGEPGTGCREDLDEAVQDGPGEAKKRRQTRRWQARGARGSADSKTGRRTAEPRERNGRDPRPPERRESTRAARLATTSRGGRKRRRNATAEERGINAGESRAQRGHVVTTAEREKVTALRREADAQAQRTQLRRAGLHEVFCTRLKREASRRRKRRAPSTSTRGASARD